MYATPLLVPYGVVAVTVTPPAECAGLAQRTCVLLSTLIPVAALPLNDTLEQPVRFVPVNVHAVPPAVVPLFGLMDDSVGGLDGAEYVYVTPLLVPSPVVAVTLTSPAE